MPPHNFEQRLPVQIAAEKDLKMGDHLIIQNQSQQHLIDDQQFVDNQSNAARTSHAVTQRQKITVAILCFVNLINYMDRYTIAGVLIDIQNSFGIDAAQSGLLQTAFVLVYMVMAPLFGYLGDRFNRKYLMAFGVFFWCLTTLIGSFMPNYGLFLMCRCFVGIGEASYSTIAPTIIADIFVKDMRSKMLALFYFAIPVGSGLGYIVGAEVTNLAKSFLSDDADSEAWRWGLRVTPAMGVIAVLLIVFVLKEPPRGEEEGGTHLQSTSFWDDLKYLLKNRSFVLSTLSFTLVTFVAGALAFWGPLYIELAVKIQENPNIPKESVAFYFGIVAMLAGLVGVPLGSIAGQKLRGRFPYADPMVCGMGLLLSFPLIVGGLMLSETNTSGSFAVVFFGQIFLNLNWAVVSDIVLYVVIPTRRSSAEAFQILFSHALGDAGSPYLVGLVSEAFKPIIVPPHNGTITYELFQDVTSTMSTTTATDDSFEEDYVNFKSLQYALYLCCLMEIVGGLCFFWNACYITKDKANCDNMIRGVETSDNNSSNSSDSETSVQVRSRTDLNDALEPELRVTLMV